MNQGNNEQSLETYKFGPIEVRPRKKEAKTIETGRKSKDEILPTKEEEENRKLIRERNRKAAKKFKEKRDRFRIKLENDLKNLKEQQTNILMIKEKLLEKKSYLENSLKQHNHISNENEVIKYSDNFNSPTVEELIQAPEINYDFDISFLFDITFEDSPNDSTSNSAKQSPNDSLSSLNKSQRERNRLAARRFRERKLKEIAFLDNQVEETRKQNENELLNVEKIKIHILELENYNKI